MIARLATAWICLGLLTGCSGLGGSGAVPTRLQGVPWVAGDAAAEAVLAAREALAADDEDLALEHAERALATDPWRVDAHRVRQDVLRGRGRLGLLLAEAEQRLESVAGPQQRAVAMYLRGRIERDSGRQLEWFERARDEDRHSFWPWLGLAHALRDVDLGSATTVYRDLAARSGGHPLVLLGLGSTLLEVDADEEAHSVYERLGNVDPRWRGAVVGLGEFGLASANLALGRSARSWESTLAGLRARPGAGVGRSLVARFVARGLSPSRREELLAVFDEDPVRRQRFLATGGAPLLARLHREAGDPLAAAAAAEEAPPTHRADGAARQSLMLDLLSAGSARDYLRLEREAMPDWFLVDERNAVRGRWRALFDGPWMDASDPLGDPELAPGLVAALRDVGRLEACQRAGDRALSQLPADAVDARAAVESARDDARRQSAFETGIAALLRSDDAPRNVDAALAALARIGERCFGRPLVDVDTLRDAAPRFSVPLVGVLADPFEGPFARHFDRFNKHLILGHRVGGRIEAMLITRLEVRELEDEYPRMPLRGRAVRVTGDDVAVRAVRGVLGGDLAGIALLNHYVIDMDAVRVWAGSVRRRRASVERDVILADPVPDGVDELDPVDANWRLGLRAPVTDQGLERAVFELICAHEHAHLVDSFHFLPPERRLWRVLGLLVGRRLNPFRVEAHLEGRAEAASLAYSGHVDLVLAHLVDFLVDPDAADTSPHAAGFRRIVEQLVEGLRADPEYSDDAAVSRWHRVPAEAFERVAEQIVGTYW